MLITFDKGGIKRQIEFGQPYQHKRFFEPPQWREKFFYANSRGSGGMVPQKILKITFSRLAETDFPGIKVTKKFKKQQELLFKVKTWLDLAGSMRF